MKIKIEHRRNIMMYGNETQTAKTETTFSGQYIRVRIDDDIFGVDIIQTQGVVGSREFSPIPNTPEYVRGTMKLVGEEIPVIDMRAKFGLESVTSDFHTHIILANVRINGKQVKAGLLVDEVMGVDVTIPSAVSDAPSYGESKDNQYLFGVLNRTDGAIKMLDVEKVLSSSF
jgi:purine-binding chemotaxis protein CheW